MAIIIKSSNGQPTEFTIKKGQKVWEINTITGVCILAKLEQTKSTVLDKGGLAWKIIEQEDCVYLPAREKEQAKKNFGMLARAAKQGKVLKIVRNGN